MPAFAIDRTELVLLRIGALMTQGLVPTVPVHVDSPMAVRALDVYRRALAGVDPALLPAGWDSRTFGVPDLRICHSATESQALNEPRHPCIVISASGMATGGRVVHHLAHQLGDPRNCVVLTGYQAVGTRGRDLVSGARQVKVHGRYVPVRAEVVDDREFSVHADSDELVQWLARCDPPPRAVYVVHGEEDAARALADRVSAELAGWRWCRATASGCGSTEGSSARLIAIHPPARPRFGALAVGGSQ